LAEPTPIRLYYPVRTLLPDYVRAGTGVAVSLGVLAANPVGWTLGVVVGGVLLLFGGYGARTVHQTLYGVNVDPAGITAHGLRRRRVPWRELAGVKLRHYGGRKAKRADDDPTQRGFHQLTLHTARGRMTLESNLESFAYVVWRAARAARTGGLGLDPVTAENMLALGVDPDGETRPPEAVCDLAARVDGIQP
jgi:hypothetical protein